MGSKRPKRTEIDRLAVKTLDDRFLTEIQKGLNCSPVESEAVLSVVNAAYLLPSERSLPLLHELRRERCVPPLQLEPRMSGSQASGPPLELPSSEPSFV